MKTTQSFLSQIRNLIAKDSLGEAIALLFQFLQNSPKLDEAIQHSARYKDICREISLGKISLENATLVKNQIRWGLLDLLRNIEQNAGKAGLFDFLEELEKQNSDQQIGAEMEQATKTIIQNAEKIYNIERIDIANFS